MLAFAHDALDGRIFLREARILARAGHEVTIVGRGRTRRLLETSSQDDVRFVLLPRRPVSMFYRLLTDPPFFAWMLLVVLVRCRSAQVFHCHEYQSLLIGWICAGWNRAKLVYDCHEFQPESFGFQIAGIHKKLYEPARGGFEHFERVFNRRVDAAIVAHEGLVERFRRDAGIVIAFPNYPSIKLAEAAEDASGDWVEGIRQKTVLVFSGFIDPLRGVDNIIRMLHFLKPVRPDVHLLLVGDCAEAYRFELQALAAGLGVGGDLTFAGRFKEDQLGRYLKLGRLGMLLLDPDYPWHRYSEGTKFYQYAAAGLPVVVSRVPIYERLSEQGGNGLVVDPRRPEDVAEKVAALLADPARMAQMARTGRDAFLKQWNLGAIEGRLLKLYEGLQEPASG